MQSARFELPLTYAVGEREVRLGEILRIPLGTREIYAFALSDARDGEPFKGMREIVDRCELPRAFDETGLALARFIANHDLCTLGEGLRCVVLGSAIPRIEERIELGERTREIPRERGRELLALIRDEFADGATLDAILRHRAARHLGDRAALLEEIAALTRDGALLRRRTHRAPKVEPYRVRVLLPGSGAAPGKKSGALLTFVASGHGVPRADAVLAGFSPALIARSIALGAIIEEQREPPPRSAPRAVAPPAYPPTAEQARAIERLLALHERGEFAAVLLNGVTGSGKTYVYLELVARTIAQGGRAIVLVPEIALTPQTARRFEERFGERVAVLHSALSERERFDAWQACAREEVEVVVGARSAVFAPLPEVRVIIVDEAHDASYRQDQAPRYSALTVARERMRLANGLLVMGSATPSFESLAAVRDGRLEELRLTLRATEQAMPQITVVDLAAAFRSGERRMFSNELTEALAARLVRGEKSLLFVNRRGSARAWLCRSCGKAPECPRCSVTLTVHRDEELLRCHYCDFRSAIPKSCPHCSAQTLGEFGIGTERVAAEVTRLFPPARVLRMDSDTTTHIGEHARIIDRFIAEGDVLVGTQMIAKGHDFERVTLVGVVAADLGLHAPDFRAAERTFQMLTQVCGRSGRAQAGEAILQTYAPEHPVIRALADGDEAGFIEAGLREREELGFPPKRRLLYLGVIGLDQEETHATAQRYAALLHERKEIDVRGPAPYPIARLNERWRYRIALLADSGATLRNAVRDVILPLARKDRQTHLAISVDP
ncbi:MAG TPA: primosomal protein N' [Candidatus Dormibacteraeota bacterium]|nr:primosomal protein N' [Candidatus Dormibacteraeota bacterium]